MIVHRHFKGVDCDAFEDFMKFLRPGLKLRPRPGDSPFFADCRLGEVADIMVWRTEYGRGISYTASDAPDRLLVLAPRTGGIHAPGSISEPVGRDHFLSVWDQDLESLDFQEGTSSDGMLVPMSLLSNRLLQRLERPLSQPLRFSPAHDATEGPAASVRLVLSGLLTALQSRLSVLDGTGLKSASSTLVDLILEVLPHNYTQALQAPPSRIAPRQVRRAIAYINDSPMPVLTIDELAAVCNVSARSLQYAFRDFVGVAPSEYWRRIRLEKALHQLRKHPSSSISQVAAAWGFTNVTRFRVLCAAMGSDDVLK